MRLTGWRFACVLALPLAAATLAVYLLTFELLQKVSLIANQASHERSLQIVRSAIEQAERKLATIAMDNSHWETAVHDAYGGAIANWSEQALKELKTKDPGFDGVLIADRDMARPIIGYKNGLPFEPVLRDYFGSSFPALLARLSDDFSRHEVQTTLARTPAGLAIVAAAPIMSPSGRAPDGVSKARYIVFYLHLTPDRLEAIGIEHLVGGLRLAGATAEPGFVQFTDIGGKPVAEAVWNDTRPGDDALQTIMVKAAIALGLLALVMAGTGFFCWRLMRTIGEREAQARRDALSDPLTGLPNRTALRQELEQRNVEQACNIALAYVDLDGFKEVNDRYDHHVGDELIREVAARMAGIIGPGAFLARVGGDEFVAVFDGLSAANEAVLFAERLIAHMKPPFDLEGRRAVIGASIGAASAPAGSMPGLELLRRADVAMYEAKGKGRNRLCLYQQGIDEERQAELRIAAELRSAILDRSIDVAYQPVVRASDLAITGVEALARWPKNSYVKHPPDRFISIAEENGLIDDLGALVLEKACEAVLPLGALRVAVNISPVQMRSPLFVKRSLSVIRASGIDPQRVEFEVTEGVLLDNLERTRVQFEELRQAGITIALDDFGAGYSSIGYLRSIDFDRIKIDRAIVSNLLHDMRQQSIIQGTVTMARGMGASVLAEGVESSDEVLLLRLAGCEELQGYLFHKPMSAADLAKLMTAGEAEQQAKQLA